MNFTNEKELYAKLLDNCKDGSYILTAGKIHDDILTIHDTPEGKHLGFGYFIGTTNNGHEFNFEGGGAMHSYKLNDKYCVSFCYLRSRNIDAVAYDLKYDHNKMLEALRSLAQ